MTVTRLTSYIHRKMINTPLFPPTQRRRHKDNLQCPGNDPFLAINSDPEPRVLNLGSRHPRVLWSPQSIFNDFDIKQSLLFFIEGRFLPPMAHFRGAVVVVRPVGPGGRRLLGHVTMSPWSPAHHEALGVWSETWAAERCICWNLVSSYVPIQNHRVGIKLADDSSSKIRYSVIGRSNILWYPSGDIYI